MKALVLAGGKGSRLRPLTYTGAKQLVPVANKPILFYCIDNLVEAGIVDIGVVISPETGDQISGAISAATKDCRLPYGCHFTFIKQDRPGGLAHAVLVAEPFLGDSDFVMYLGDNLIGSKLQLDGYPGFDAKITLKRVSNPSAFGVAELEGDKIVRVVEKPTEPKSDLAVVGIYKFRKSIFHAIDKISPSARGELEMSDAISKLIEMGYNVGYDIIDSWWLDTGKKDDLLSANATVLDAWLKSKNNGSVDPASKIEGRVDIGASHIMNSTIRGPVCIGNKVVIENSYIGPYTSIGDGCIIRDSQISDSVLMENVECIGVPSIVDSLLGNRCKVRSSEDQHRSGLSLNVGDDCVIEV